MTLRERFGAAVLFAIIAALSFTALAFQRDRDRVEAKLERRALAYLDDTRPEGDLNVLIDDRSICLGARGTEWDPQEPSQWTRYCWLQVSPGDGYAIVVRDRREAQ